MTNLKTVLIFGVSSFVGSNLAEFLKRYYKVVGTYHHTPVNIPGVLTMPCDVLVRDQVQYTLFKIRPDITIYCVGLSSLEACAEHPDHADALNTAGLFNITDYCQRYKSQVCFISSCYVFGGENKEYVETDIPDANTIYGKALASAEFFIQKTSLNYIIFRCCPLYGRSYRPDLHHWFEKIQRHFKSGQTFTVDGHVKTGILDVYYLGMIIHLCFDLKVTNRLFQLSSNDVGSRYDFAKLYAKVFGYMEDAVGKSKWRFPLQSGTGAIELGEAPVFKLNITNIEGHLNIRLPTIQESLEYTKMRFYGSKKKKQGKTESVKFI